MVKMENKDLRDITKDYVTSSRLVRTDLKERVKRMSNKRKYSINKDEELIINLFRESKYLYIDLFEDFEDIRGIKNG